jgi:carboxypeptidase Taq
MELEMVMQAKLQELKACLLEINDLNAAGSVLSWDQSTYMPPGGGPARARQMSTLRRLAHVKATDPALGQLLDELRSYEESLPYDSDEAGLIRVARRDYERAAKIPPDFLAQFSRHRAESFNWRPFTGLSTESGPA